MSFHESTSFDSGRRRKLIPDGQDIWPTQLLLTIKVGNPSQVAIKASASGNNSSKSLIKRILDYFDPSTEPSILIDADLEKLGKKYFILITSNLELLGQVIGLHTPLRVVWSFMKSHFDLDCIFLCTSSFVIY